ncbi:hypothetical protein LCGC14_1080730 [marine sediment metagenome]|uniref:Uncharacterized protein n=1 Tax=marine sediment metagenome TaxID=412755 RepID=A0A0F9PYH1_9ZZZZ
MIPMLEEEKTLNIIDKTLKAAETTFQEFIKVLENSRTELVKLESDKEELNTEKEKLEQEKIKLEQDKIKLEEETKQLERDKQERDQKIGSLTEEQVKLLDEYKKVKVELQKFMKATEEAEHAEFNFDKVRALLSIYTVLVSEIWQGQPHYRILKILHGDKESMSRDEIKNTTGISGAFVLRSVQELAKVELVDYDMDTQMVKLKKRLFEKKALLDQN